MCSGRCGGLEEEVLRAGGLRMCIVGRKLIKCVCTVVWGGDKGGVYYGERIGKTFSVGVGERRRCWVGDLGGV
jgi:hypothetical protein